MSARFSVQDYAAALKGLMPRGRVWPEDGASLQSQVLTALAGALVRSDATAVGLVADAFPATTQALLPEWEASLGLPDPCAGPSASPEQRRAQVLARFVGGGGMSAARYIAFAAELGFTISIRTYAPFRVGVSKMGQALAASAWSFAWGVKVEANDSGLDPSVLLCELRAIRPAETIVFLVS